MPSNQAMTKNIGIIGLGSIGQRHARNLVEMGHKVWGYDPDLSQPAILGIIRCSTIDAVRNNSEALIIASPSNLHCIHYLESPNIPTLIEKPIGCVWADLYQYQFAFRDKYAPVMVGCNLRMHNCVKKAKEWLAEGLIGKPLWASFTIAQHNTKYTDPVILNWGAHECDLALYLLGPATVTAAAGNDQIFDMCLLHEYGVPSTVHMDYVAKAERRYFAIIGEAGNLCVSLSQRRIWVERPNGQYDSILEFDYGSWDQDYKDEMQEFIDRIDGKTEGLVGASGADGLAALELILEAQKIAGIS